MASENESPPGPPVARGRWSSPGGVLGVAILSLLVVAVRLQLWHADLRVPFQYAGDSFTNQLMIKSIIDTGWWLENDYVGAPGRLEFYDYPCNPTLHLLVIKFISLLTRNPAVVLNVYFLLSFPAVAVSAYAAFRTVGAGKAPAVVAGVLYSMLHYHFWRNESHLFLAAYFTIPLGCVVAFWLVRGDRLFVARDGDGRLQLCFRWQTWVALFISAMAGLDFPYYPVFLGLVFVLAGTIGAFGRRDGLVFCRSAVLTGVVALFLAVSLSPNIVYRYYHGPNPSKGHDFGGRTMMLGEYHALKPIQLILPALGHPVPALSALRDKYYTETLYPGESDSVSLGAVGTLGLLVAISGLFWQRGSAAGGPGWYHTLGLFSVCCILVGTVGGFGLIPNLLGFPMMRCYNRLSIFIGLFSFAAVALGLTAAARRLATVRFGRFVPGVVYPCMIGLGVWDQVPVTYVPPYSATKATYRSDAEFVARVEAASPPGAMIYQLPYISFCSTNHAGAHTLEPFSHFRGYFHSRALRWSYGAMHGREDDQLHARLATLPTAPLVDALVALGFKGVYVDRHGYPDDGQGIEQELRGILCVPPVVSRNGRLTFYSLEPYERRTRGGPGETRRTEIVARLREALEPIWQGGFSIEEHNGAERWRWCAADGELVLDNRAGWTKSVRLAFSARLVQGGNGRLTITGPGFEEELPLSAGPQPFRRTVDVPPGRTVIRFRSDGAPLVTPGRTIVFGLFNTAVEEP